MTIVTPPKNSALIMTRAEALSLACLRVTQLAVRIALGVPTHVSNLVSAFVDLECEAGKLYTAMGCDPRAPAMVPTATWETCTHDGASAYQTFAALGQRVTLLSRPRGPEAITEAEMLSYTPPHESWSILVDMNPVAETSHLDGAYALGQLIVDGLAVRKARLDK